MTLEDFVRTWDTLRAELGDRAAHALAEESNGRRIGLTCRVIALRCVEARQVSPRRAA